MIAARVAPLLILATACVPAQPVETVPIEDAAANAPAAPQARPTGSTEATPPIPGPPLAPATLSGQYEQGGWIRGTAPFDTVAATLNGDPFPIDPQDRAFFIGLDRDAEATAELVFTARDGQTRVHRIEVARRDWNIEHVNVARRPGGASASFMRRRQPELDAIWNARLEETGAEGWRQDFIWPVTGRISGRFGSQRIYRGEPGSYHSGIDISTGRSGTPYVAPADGVVVLAEDDFSLEGKLLIIDHGQGLNSAFLHSSQLHVRKGDIVRQGQHIGDIGSSGRATGPHLHWSLKWRNSRLDPLLFTGPMR
ncbi:MAG: M23 family metallopeptidase [Erythrobacter sp.]